MTAPPEQIVTGRLLLRKPSCADAAAVFSAYASDPDVTRYLSWSPSGSVQDVEVFLRKVLADWERGSAFAWAVVLRGTGELIGMVEARVDAYMVNLGFVIARRHWGLGLATEAVRAVCAWADGEIEIERLWAVCDVENLASARVLEKAGLACEGVLRRYSAFPNIGGAPRDCYSFARIREHAHAAPP